ncbi:hypothetical protein AAAC51_10000 [Priestia megaterium]
MNPSPLLLNERLAALDIIRGIALLGIFLVNIPAFASPIFIFQLYDVPYEYKGMDAYIDLFLLLFVQGKFFTIFSFYLDLGAESFGIELKKRITLPLLYGQEEWLPCY